MIEFLSPIVTPLASKNISQYQVVHVCMYAVDEIV